MPTKRTIPSVAQRLQGLDRLIGFQLGAAGGHVDLDRVEPVGAEAAQALLQVGANVGRPVVVRVGRLGVRRQLKQAAELQG